jgi:hypothetical protein
LSEVSVGLAAVRLMKRVAQSMSRSREQDRDQGIDSLIECRSAAYVNDIACRAAVRSPAT